MSEGRGRMRMVAQFVWDGNDWVPKEEPDKLLRPCGILLSGLDIEVCFKRLRTLWEPCKECPFESESKK